MRDEKVRTCDAGDRRQREHRHGNDKKPPHRQQAGQESGERNRDDFCDQICGLDPANLILSDVQCLLNGRQRRCNDLHIQNR